MNLGSVKKMLYSAVISSMIFYIVVTIMSGFQASGMAIHWIMAFAVFAAANLLVPYVLKFFTLPRNFFMYWLMSSLTSIGGLYAISLFIPGITIGETILDPVTFGIISVNPYTLPPFASIVVAGIIAGLLSATLYWLDSE